jgi:hypothetical protein
LWQEQEQRPVKQVLRQVPIDSVEVEGRVEEEKLSGGKSR